MNVRWLQANGKDILSDIRTTKALSEASDDKLKTHYATFISMFTSS